MTDSPKPTSAAPTGAEAVTAAWSGLDRLAQYVVGGSIAAVVITILGLPFGTWDSTDFVLLILAASIIAMVAAAAGTTSRDPEPLALLEGASATVLAVLAVSNLIEILFNLDLGDRGGIIGILFTIALVIAGVVVLAGAFQRVGGLPALHLTEGRGVGVAAAGLILVLVAWVLNLSIGQWTMAGASLSLAVLTVATAVILVSRRVSSPIPAAWAGVIVAVFGAILALGQWGDLNALGQEQVELGPLDFLAFLLYIVGLVMIIAGGVMTALEQKPINLAIDKHETVEPADRVNRIE